MMLSDKWIDAMIYHKVPENEWQAFYDWYSFVYHDGTKAISAAYEEWKATSE